MDTFNLVLPEHLNHHGFLFGGYMLKWVDEYVWLTASRDFPGHSLVTRAMDSVEFRHRVKTGAILRFHIMPARRGRTSIQYHVDVYADEPGAARERLVFSNKVTLVCLAEDGTKRPLPDTSPLRSEQSPC